MQKEKPRMMAIRGARDFLRRQSHNYRMVLVRSAGANFLMNLTSNYTSIYTTALGADAVTLGSLRSVSSFINMIISMPSGWVSDRYDLRKVMGIGMVFQVLMIALYAFARDWTWILVAMAISPFTMALLMRSQMVMISRGLKDADRAQGFSLRQVVAQLIGIVAPIPAALLVERFGGLTVEGIRPLFYLRLAGTILVYSFVYVKLVGVPPAPRGEETSFLQDFGEVFREGEGLKSWIVVSCAGSVIMGMIEPFTFLYAAEVKGADALTLGILSTAATLSSIVFSLPISRLADTRGRKLAFLITRPARLLWMLLLVSAPHPSWLILAWVFRGVSMSGNAYQTWMLELVPAERRGRWLGVVNTFNSVARIPAPIMGGFLYQGVHPGLIFMIPFALELFVRAPICYFKVPETLRKASVLVQADPDD